LKNLGVQTHRMSLEWSRIEPSRGKFSDDAMNITEMRLSFWWRTT